MDYTNLRPNQDVDENGLVFEIGSLYAYFQRVKDTRKPKGKLYPLPLLLALIMMAKLGGEDKPSGIVDWIAHRVEQLSEMKILKKKRVPGHMTYRRVLSDTLQPEEFERLIREYHQKQLKDGLEMVFSMDGKAVRGTIPSGELRGTICRAFMYRSKAWYWQKLKWTARKMRLWWHRKSSSKSICKGRL